MRHIRADNEHGFVMRFKGEDAALAWCKCVVLSEMYISCANKREAYIFRKWVDDNLEKKLVEKEKKGEGA